MNSNDFQITGKNKYAGKRTQKSSLMYVVILCYLARKRSGVQQLTVEIRNSKKKELLCIQDIEARI